MQPVRVRQGQVDDYDVSLLERDGPTLGHELAEIQERGHI
jgi:hypothetical protein